MANLHCVTEVTEVTYDETYTTTFLVNEGGELAPEDLEVVVSMAYDELYAEDGFIDKGTFAARVEETFFTHRGVGFYELAYDLFAPSA